LLLHPERRCISGQASGVQLLLLCAQTRREREGMGADAPSRSAEISEFNELLLTSRSLARSSSSSVRFVGFMIKKWVGRHNL
jgi:hypothetical protein